MSRIEVAVNTSDEEAFVDGTVHELVDQLGELGAKVRHRWVSDEPILKIASVGGDEVTLAVLMRVLGSDVDHSAILIKRGTTPGWIDMAPVRAAQDAGSRAQRVDGGRRRDPRRRLFHSWAGLSTCFSSTAG